MECGQEILNLIARLCSYKYPFINFDILFSAFPLLVSRPSAIGPKFQVAGFVKTIWHIYGIITLQWISWTAASNPRRKVETVVCTRHPPLVWYNKHDTEAFFMNGFKTVEIKDLQFNPFTLIDKEWMLITAGNEQKCAEIKQHNGAGKQLSRVLFISCHGASFLQKVCGDPGRRHRRRSPLPPARSPLGFPPGSTKGVLPE